MKNKNTCKTVIILFLTCTLFFPGYICHAGNRDLKRIKDLNHASGKLGTFKALIIGINQYNDPKIPDLKTAVSDAKALADVLQNQYGFTIQMLLNNKATKKGIYQALRKLSADSREEDSVLIYYAGHGDLDKLFGSGWWIPVDADAADQLTFLENNKIQQAMRTMAAKHVLLISDSCYSGTLFGEARSLPPRITDNYYLSLYNEKSRWGMTSGNKTPVSDSGTGGHSVFAYQLLKELQKTDKPYLSTQELYTRIAPIIRNNSEQTPICRPIRNTGDQGGEFVFVRLAGGSMLVEQQALQQAQQQTAGGSLVVKTQPAGAEIFIDGFFEGVSPLTLNKLQPGGLTVKAEKSGYGPEQKKIRIRSGRKSTITLILDKIVAKSSLTVKATPVDSLIRILNIVPKYTAGMALEPGVYKVEVSRNGYKTSITEVNLKEGEDLVVPVELQQKIAVAVTPPNPANSSTLTDPTTGMEFVYVKGGCYQMGDTFGDGDNDEKPVHEVCVDDFYMGKYEVTQKEWREVMGSNPSSFKFKNGDTYPVETVSWDDIQKFIKKLNSRSGKKYRLPTEAEWEYAARSGGKKEKYSGGNDVDAVAWYGGNSGDKTHPVGQKQKNGLGLYDMSGNVVEWCQDRYGPDYYQTSPRNNPLGRSSVGDRVIRGGCWAGVALMQRSATRNFYSPDDRNVCFGFRLLRTP